VRCKLAVFCQTEPLFGIISTGTEKGGFRGFPELTYLSRREKEPEMGLFSLKIQTLLFPVSSKGGINGG
jgi:hypothetical protein